MKGKGGKYRFECTTCGMEYSDEEVEYLCPACAKGNTPDRPPAGVLKTLFDYDEIGDSYTLDQLIRKKYEPLLPFRSVMNLSSLEVGRTPLCGMDSSQVIPGSDARFRVFFKDESRNPTFSLKDRASDVVCAVAVEKNISTVVTASTGNAGSSLAGICASMGLKSVIFVPVSAPVAKLTQISMYGAELITVDGNYDDAFEFSLQATAEYGWYNRNTAYNPFTIEGKKIVSFEIFEQLKRKIPDRIFVPVGDGCIISGVFKGFEDLLKLGAVDEMPIIVAVQSEKSDNLVRNLGKDEFHSIPSDTIADSIAVDVPRNYMMTEQFMKLYNGEYITVSDEEIIDAEISLGRNTGLFAEPAAAAAFAGLLKYERDDRVPENSSNVVLLTGSGLKDLDAVSGKVSLPRPISSIKEIDAR